MRKGSGFYNATIGISGLVVSVIALALSAAMLMSPRQTIDMDALKKRSVDGCQQTAQREGFMVKPQGLGLEMKMSGLTSHKEKLLLSGLVVSQCQGLELSSFCMGECLDDQSARYEGLIMNLTYQDPEMK